MAVNCAHQVRARRLTALRNFAVLSTALMVAWGLMATVPAAAHRPDSKYVQSMVKPAVEYLTTGAVSDDQYGRMAICALALVKAGEDERNPRVAAAIESIIAELRLNNEPRALPRMYSASVALIFLCELDAQKYQAEIQALLDKIVARQMSIGGWGYMIQKTGDVSQTQYCCLALWTAHKFGFQVDPDVGRNALNWLMTVQDLGGGYPYQGIYNGPLQRINQGNITHSLSAAGLGSVYIVADWLGYGKADQKDRRAKQSEGLPATVSIVVSEEEAAAEEELISVNTTALAACKRDGDEWFRKFFAVEVASWNYYYLYGYERYASFREKALGIEEDEPDWYNKGCEFLKQKQDPDGYWQSQSQEAGRDVATAFALLFLLRSTKQSLGKVSYTDGTLRGGQGLRDDAEVALRGGNVVSIPLQKDLSQLVAMLANQEGDELEAFMDSIEEINLDDPNMSETQKMATLRTLISNEDWRARRAIVNSMGSKRNMEHIPLLLYALSDPDLEVAALANKKLQFISRKIDDFTTSENPTEEEFKALKTRWTEWYLSIRPDAQLLD